MALSLQTFQTAIALTAFGLEATLLWRASRRSFLRYFPYFYSFVACVFFGSTLTWIVYEFRPRHYPEAYWFHFTLIVLVEFAVLVEISEHAFKSSRALRGMGALLVAAGTLFCFFTFILPALLKPTASSTLMMELALRVALTKALIIVALLLTAVRFRMPLSRNVSGMLAGFAIYLCAHVALFASALMFGKTVDARLLSWMVPLSFVLALYVWVVSLWNYEPVRVFAASNPADKGGPIAGQRDELARSHLTLTRLLRR